MRRSWRSRVGLCVLAFTVSAVRAVTAADLSSEYEARNHRVGDGVILPYRLLKPKQVESGRVYPLVLFLHGAGERGHNNTSQLMSIPARFAGDEIRTRYPCYVVAPQCFWNQKWVAVPWGSKSHTMPAKPTSWMQGSLELVEVLAKEFPVDPKRIYVTGFSMGGYGVWDALQRRPDLFAAAVPVCGGGDVALAKTMAGVPIWAFHSVGDPTVPSSRSRDMVEAVKAAGGSPKYTEFPGNNHNSWDPAFADPELLPWLFAQKKTETAVRAIPRPADTLKQPGPARGRDRPVMDPARRTFLSDRKTLLRGPRYSTDITYALPERRAVSGLKDRGCNALHLYAEAFSAGKPAGHNAKLIDELVRWTREDGLYLILTIGNLTKNCEFDHNYVMAFWDIYAGRYASETHVLYEIQNEPAKVPGYSEAAMKMTRDAYAKIRSKAPDTPVLLFSYALFVNPLAVLQDIKNLGEGIDWQKTAIAFHGYALGDAIFCLDGVLKAGYPCFQTEFADLSMIRDFESRGVSWLSFVDLPQMSDDKEFKNHLDKAGIGWVPDYGQWPRPAAATP